MAAIPDLKVSCEIFGFSAEIMDRIANRRFASTHALYIISEYPKQKNRESTLLLRVFVLIASILA